ncbi:MAG: hypothetical protein ACLVJH_10705 [Faecalibacterium prausnitzii]
MFYGCDALKMSASVQTFAAMQAIRIGEGNFETLSKAVLRCGILNKPRGDWRERGREGRTMSSRPLCLPKIQKSYKTFFILS